MPNRYHQFLAACIRRDGEQLRALIREPGWTWEDLFRFASEEALLPALYGRLSELEITVPPEVAGFLFAVESVNRDRNASILTELKHAVALLNGVGINPVLLKGVAYLATGIYPDPAARYIGDIDLLVPESQIPAAVEALTSNQYQRDTNDPFGPFRHHHPPLHRVGRAQIELHHSLGLGKRAQLLPAEQVIAQSLPCDLDGVSVRIPCPEHLATHLILHSQILHSYTERIWPPYRAMCDFVSLDRRYGAGLKWSDVQARFRDAGEYGTLVLHLMQIRSTLGILPSVALKSTVLTRIRWYRRKFLRRVPAVRYLDPIYMFSAVLSKRFLMLRILMGNRCGWKYFSTRLIESQLYLRLWTDLVEGRGR